MFRQKVQKIYLIGCILIFALATIIAALSKFPNKAIFLIFVSVSLVWFLGSLAIENINKRIYNIRVATENLKPEETEIYIDDELGKLASEIDKLIKLYEESLESKTKEKEFLRDIISDMSHQIKTPLASLSLFNEILQEDLNDERFKDMVESSNTQLERIKWLILSMLQLSKIEAKSVCFNKSYISSISIITSCVDILKTSIDAKSLKINLPSVDYDILVDGEWLKEALVNIIKNAVEYSDFNSKIDITLSKTPVATTFSITDYGDGISEEDRLNVFKRFYRTEKSKSDNVGIGLSLSKSIIEEMGGRIWIESRHKDECINGEHSYTSIYIMF